MSRSIAAIPPEQLIAAFEAERGGLDALFDRFGDAAAGSARSRRRG